MYVQDDDVAARKSYSAQDKLRFKQAARRDAKLVSRHMNHSPDGAKLSREQVYECIGIELGICDGLARHVAEVKRAHVAAVLSEQRFQRFLRVCDPGKVSQVSQESSRWSKLRARKLATAYDKLMMRSSDPTPMKAQQKPAESVQLKHQHAWRCKSMVARSA